MSELVCFNCGREMEYDWAPCPNCGWKASEPWEETPEEREEGPALKGALLSKTSPWIQWTVWILLAAGLAGLWVWFFHSR